MATYAIGDIHGCLKALQTIFEQVDFKDDDLIVFLGDYVDRGSDSKGVIDFLLALKEKHQVVFLQGNHELMMLGAKEGSYANHLWLMYGGNETLASYSILDDPKWALGIPTSHWDFLSSGLPYFEKDELLFVHAGLESEVPLEAQTPRALFWKKYETPNMYDSQRQVICGHTSRKEGRVADFGHTICLDTYCYGGQWLTCMRIEDDMVFQANEEGAFRQERLVRPKKRMPPLEF